MGCWLPVRSAAGGRCGQRAADADAAAGPGGCRTGGGARWAVHGTGVTGVLGRIFWKPSTTTCSPAFRPPSTTHWLPRAAPSCTLRCATLLVSADHQHRVAGRTAGHGLLRQQDGAVAAGLVHPHLHVQAGQQIALGVGHLGAQRHLARLVASTVRSENSSLPACAVFAAVFQHHAAPAHRAGAPAACRPQRHASGAAASLADWVKLT